MLHLLKALVALSFLAFSDAFHQGFLTPKLLVFNVLALVACTTARQHLVLPPQRQLLGGAIALMVAVASALTCDSPVNAMSQVAYWVTALLLYLGLTSLPLSSRSSLLDVIFWVAVAQVPVVALQLFAPPSSLPTMLTATQHGITGTVGNREFLATLLAVGWLVGYQHVKHGQASGFERLARWAGLLLLLVALVGCRSKGTLAMMVVLGVAALPRYRRTALLGVAVGAVTLAIMSPASVKGRLLLWIASASVLVDHPLLGVGPGQLSHWYIETVGRLFTSHPILAHQFGSHAATTTDAHNLILDLGAELGWMGVVMAVWLLVGLFRTGWRARFHAYGMAVLVLAVKCLYTVVGSVTSVVLLVLVVAALAKEQDTEPTARTDAPRVLVPTTALATLMTCAWLAASDLFLGRGMRASFGGQPVAAREHFITACGFNPENADAWLGLGFLSFHARDFDDMDEALKIALHHKRDVDTCKKSAHMYFYSQRYDQALRLYGRLHAAHPEHMTSTVKLALIRMAWGEYNSALVLAREALKLQPRIESDSDDRNREISTRLIKDLETRLNNGSHP